MGRRTGTAGRLGYCSKVCRYSTDVRDALRPPRHRSYFLKNPVLVGVKYGDEEVSIQLDPKDLNVEPDLRSEISQGEVFDWMRDIIEGHR